MRENRPTRTARRVPAGKAARVPAGTTAVNAGGKVTVKDIARAAGVSVATVSRVLNNPDLVTGDRREAVLGALRQS